MTVALLSYVLKKLFYFDIRQLFGKLPLNLKSVLTETNLNPIIDEKRTHHVDVDGKKMSVHEFKCGNDCVFIDESKLKYFDLNISTFKGTNRKSPVHIYEGDIKVGVVLPVIFKNNGGITDDAEK